MIYQWYQWYHWQQKNVQEFLVTIGKNGTNSTIGRFADFTIGRTPNVAHIVKFAHIMKFVHIMKLSNHVINLVHIKTIAHNIMRNKHNIMRLYQHIM